MTLITFQGGKPVMRDGKVGTESGCCCDCTPCERCNHGCLAVTFTGFSGDGECDECANLNGTYTLKRGTGLRPTVQLSVTASTGSGATVSPVLSFNKAAGTYSIASVTVNSGGDGYSSDASISYTIADGIVACGDPPEFAVEIERTTPTLEIGVAAESDLAETGPAGSGAVLEPTFTPINTTPGQETWGLSGVTVTSGGTNYEDGRPITITITDGVQVTAASGSIRVAHAIPQLDAFSVETTSGSGATFSSTWAINQEVKDFWDALNAGWDGRWWYIDSLTVTNGGTGYAVGDDISYTLSGAHRSWNHTNIGPFYIARVSTIGGSGEITGLDFFPPEQSHYKTTGAITSVYVAEDGEYYSPGGVLSVDVLNGGTIWPSEACRYSLCEQTECTYEGEPKCRKISLDIGPSEHTLTVTLDGEEPPLLSATIPAEGNSCGDLEFTSESITTSCGTVGTVTVAGVECDGPPDEESCCVSSLCCTCGIIELTHVARYDNYGATNIIPGLAPTEPDALDAQAAYIAATGWARGAVGGNGPGDGMSLADAAEALSSYGCGDTVTVSAPPPYYYSDGVDEGWVMPLPSITVRCCGTYLPEGGPYEDPAANPPVLKAGAIDTWPWLVESSDYREVLFPCIDDGSNVFCVPCSDSIPACQSGPCTTENEACGENPLP